MNLQEQVNFATPGAVVQHDTEYVGNLIVNKSLTIQGTGIIRTPNADPAVRIPPMTGPVTLRGLEITSDSNWPQVGALIQWGSEGIEQNTIDKVPQGLTVESCDVHGQPNQTVQRGIAANGANLKVLKSKIREIHAKGIDTQAICAWNGPGPFLIEDSYLEAAGENIMFGGAFVSILNLVPSDITIRRCQFFKPLSWKGVWTVKNLFELKNARRVVVEDSTFENSWIDGQDGYAWVFTCRGEAGDRNWWNVVEQVLMRNNTVKNANRGVQTLGRDDLAVSQQGNHLTISSCSFEDIKDWFFVLSVFDDVTIEHVTHFSGGNNIVFTGGKSKNFAYVNNVTQYSGYGFKADGGGEGAAALTQYCDGVRFEGNVIAGAPPSQYPVNNFYPLDLSTLSSFKGTDGLTPGRIAGTLPMPQPAPDPAPTPAPPTTPTKTESPDGTKATTIVDSKLVEWSIGPPPDLLILQNGIQKGGQGTVLKYWNKTVFTLGLNGNWWQWLGSEWKDVGPNEPGAAPPTPTPVPAPPRVLRWPTGKSDQALLWQNQAKENFRPNRFVDRPAGQPKGDYVEFIRF